MAPLWNLLLFSAAMLFGCYFIGLIPLFMTLSEDRLEVVAAVGAGLLVGTALTVIIPEGVNTIYSAEVQTIQKHDDKHIAQQDEPQQHDFEVHRLIGISLLLGFVLMLFVNQCAGGHSKQDLETGISRGGKSSLTATLGLVVHAVADGIALGAAGASSHTDVEMIIFFAIVLHKAPAAFALVTFLLHEGLEKKKIKQHLFVFSLAAPLGALITYAAVIQSGSESFSSTRNTGIALLFSAGTFLYVSTVHVLPELSNHNGSNSHFSKKKLLALTVGSFLPSLLTLSH